MPYAKEHQALFDVEDSIDSDVLNCRLTAIQHIIEHDTHSFTNAEIMMLLHDLFKLKSKVANPAIIRQLDIFINQLRGHNKPSYIENGLFKSYQLAVVDLLSLSDYYQRQGISIYVQNNLRGIPKEKCLHPDNYRPSHYTSQASALDDMLSIQKTLSEDEYVGYLYTNNIAGNNVGHFEAFIIGKKIIIKPVGWLVAGKMLDLSNYETTCAETNLSDLLGISERAQAGLVECGSLSMSYLKNYLKDNARLLRDFTLSVPYYQDDVLYHFHFPAPHVLRYSQSSQYNRCFEAMLQPKGDRWEKNDKTYTILSLQRLLEINLRRATKYGHTDVIEHIKGLLEQLPAFRERWLSAYETVKHKRQCMQTPIYNQYLGYTTYRMSRIATMVKESTSNPGLPLLARLEDYSLADIKRELATIRFESADDVGYFFGKLPNTYYFELLDELTKHLRGHINFTALTRFLSPVKVLGLIDYIKKPENFSRILLSSDKTSLYTVTLWLQYLRINPEDTALFLQERLERSWLVAELKQLVLSGKLEAYLLSTFPNKMALTHFLQQYIEITDLVEFIPEVFLSSNLSALTPWFETKKALQDFVRAHVAIAFIQEALLTMADNHRRYLIATNYIKIFDKNEQSTVLFHVIGLDVLLSFLKQNELASVCILLNDYGTIEDITTFMETHQGLLLQTIITTKSISPLEGSPKLTGLVANRLHFLCPQGNEEVVTMYKEVFANLFEPYSYAKIFLRQVLDWLPLPDRWTFIETIFSEEEIKELLKHGSLSQRLPERVPTESMPEIPPATVASIANYWFFAEKEGGIISPRPGDNPLLTLLSQYKVPSIQ